MLRSMLGAVVNFFSLDIQPATPKLQDELDLVKKYESIGEIDKAMQKIKKMIFIYPDSLQVLDRYVNLTCLLGNYNDAKKIIIRKIKSKNERNYYLGLLYHYIGDLEQAKSYLQKIEDKAEDSNAKFIIDCIDGKNVTPPLGHLKGLFDAYAHSFEHSLVNLLNYDAPDRLIKIIPNINYDAVLDLGCGTGLLGVALLNKVGINNLHGVDISNEMLKRAKEKNIYSSLYQDEIINFLQHCPQKYDMIASTDVIIYLGCLDKLFSAAKKCLHQNGYLAINSEELEDSEQDLQIFSSGRYKYRSSYIIACAKNFGFECVTKIIEEVRLEKGQVVMGNYILFKQG